jgi:hypothetical protein
MRYARTGEFALREPGSTSSLVSTRRVAPYPTKKKASLALL